MSARVKSILLLAGTFLVGILLGVFATSTLQHRRMAELRQVREQGGIMRMLERTLEFESDAQRQEVEDILGQAEASFRAMRRTYTDSMLVHREELMDALQQVLTAEQLEEMEKHMTRERRSPRNRGRRNGPGRRPQQR